MSPPPRYANRCTPPLPLADERDSRSRPFRGSTQAWRRAAPIGSRQARARTEQVSFRCYSVTVDFAKLCAIKPGSKVQLADYDPGERLGLTKKQAALDKSLERLREFQHLLYADKRHSLLVILQAFDAGGKDGTIRHVMSGVNPQGCEVTAF